MPLATAAPETAANLRWLLPETDPRTAQALANALAVPPWFAAILIQRGFTTLTAAQAYLDPTPAALHDPTSMAGIPAAVDRILHAIAAREPVLIYGDYDVDGTLATVLLKTAIDRLTPKHLPSLVRFHIPHRIREGYGVQPAVLGDAAAQGVRLVVSVDTGIRAFAAAVEAKSLGLDLIVTDHHLPEALGVPEAVAVINPNQAGCGYPFKDLCGAAVAFKLAAALLLHAAARGTAAGLEPIDEDAVRHRLLPSLLKLVAIATVADSVPLHGENRVLVSLGLGSLADVRQPGLRALLQFAEIDPAAEPATATAIAFRVAPRINAAGRMDVAGDVVRMLLTRDPEEGRALAEKLHRLNADRRSVEASVLLEIEARLAAIATDLPATCLVLDGHGWHRGVIGILASRVVERTGRPALVLTHEEAINHEDGRAHGSGRSIAGFHLLDAITAANLGHFDDHGTVLFDRFGGHAHAVGFCLPSAHVGSLRQRLEAYGSTRIATNLLQPAIHIDSELAFSNIDRAALEAIRRLEPFGNGAPEPIFIATAATVLGVRLLKDRHLKLDLQQAGGPVLQCLGWSRNINWPQRLDGLGLGLGSLVDVAFHLRENRRPGFAGPELQLCDLRLHLAP